MDVGTLRWFFFWCAIFNFFILGGFFLGFIFAGDMIYSFHRNGSRWTGMLLTR